VFLPCRVGKNDGCISFFVPFSSLISVGMYLILIVFGRKGPLLRVRHCYMKRELGKCMRAALMLFSGIAFGLPYIFILCFVFLSP